MVCFVRTTDLSPWSIGFGAYWKKQWIEVFTNNITKQKLISGAKLMGANFLCP